MLFLEHKKTYWNFVFGQIIRSMIVKVISSFTKLFYYYYYYYFLKRVLLQSYVHGFLDVAHLCDFTVMLRQLQRRDDGR